MLAIRRNIERFSAASVIVLSAVATYTASADNTGGNPPVFLMTWDASHDSIGPSEYNPFLTGTSEFGTWNLGGTVNNDPTSPAFGQIMDGAPRTRTGWRTIGDMTYLNSWSMSWDCVVNEDPFVDATINVTNNSLSTQTFWVYMPLNINPAIPDATHMTSYVSAVVSDNTFDNAVFETDGVNPVFRGYIDGVAQSNAELWMPGYQLTAGFFGSNNDDETIINALGPAANSQIALRLQFNLSPGDSASVTGTFEVQPVPGPAALSLLAAAALVTRRRRN